MGYLDLSPDEYERRRLALRGGIDRPADTLQSIAQRANDSEYYNAMQNANSPSRQRSLGTVGNLGSAAGGAVIGSAVKGAVAKTGVGGALSKVLGGKILGPLLAPMPGMIGSLLLTSVLGKLFGKKVKPHTAADYNAVTSRFSPDTYVPENSTSYRQEQRSTYG